MWPPQPVPPACNTYTCVCVSSVSLSLYIHLCVYHIYIYIYIYIYILSRLDEDQERLEGADAHDRSVEDVPAWMNNNVATYVLIGPNVLITIVSISSNHELDDRGVEEVPSWTWQIAF